jgi:hypothetical protein
MATAALAARVAALEASCAAWEERVAKDKDVSKELRNGRFALVQQFWPGAAGLGGREICAACAGKKQKPSWGHCRGRGKAAGAHGPDKEDAAPATFPVGARVRWGKHTGTVTAFDRASGFFAIARDGGGSADVFLPHKSYAAAVLPALPALPPPPPPPPQGTAPGSSKPSPKPRAKAGGAGKARKPAPAKAASGKARKGR